MPIKAAGLSPKQETQYAGKLVVANLGAERTKALKLRAEAKSESKPQLVAVANDRLALIFDEQKQRGQVASARLSNGTTGTQLAQALKAVPNLQLARTEKQLEMAVASGTAPNDAKTRLLVIEREQDRREAVMASQTQARETTRLAGVKQSYGATLSGRTPAELLKEKKAEHTRLANAQHALLVAQQHLDAATTPAGRTAAQSVVVGAERNLRTEYAKAAVINAEAPVQLSRKMLHDYADSLKGKSVASLSATKAKVTARYEGMTGGGIRGTREQVQLARVQLAIIEAALKKAGGVAPIRPVDPTRNPGNVVFNGPGMMVADAGAFSAGTWAPKMKAAGVTYVMLQIHNNGPVGHNIAQLQAGWADQWRAAGIKVGFWGVSYGNAAVDAKLAAQLTAQYKGDFYVADCEGSFQAGEGDPARNKQFVDAFQAEATALGIGNVPRALSSMGRVALDMRPWIDNGWDAMPQAYMNSWQHYTPTASVKFYEDWGWPKDRIHPTIATYNGAGEGGNQTVPQHVSNYVPELKASGTKGFSFYLPESYLDDTEYQQLLAGMAQGMNG